MTDPLQIYHVARCGSTLLTSLLSSVVKAYAEPSWSRDTLNGVYYSYENRQILIKYPSTVLLNPIDISGKKVFLYRPLCQHLYKIKNVSPEWRKMRCEYLRDHIMNHGISNHITKHSKWQPLTDLELIAYQWTVAIFEMMKQKNVLWIKSNEFFSNKMQTVNTVTDHFELNRVKNYEFALFNVKKVKINGTNKECDIRDYSEEKNDIVKDNHGIIETVESMADGEVCRVTEQIELIFDELKLHTKL